MKQIFSLKPMLLVCAFFLFISQASYAQKTWDRGAGTDNWGDANNWNPNGVPTSSDAVTIASNGTVIVNITNAVCASLQLGGTSGNTRATLTFTSSGSPKLTVTNAVTVGGSGSNNQNRSGTITFVSGATLQAGSIVLTQSTSGDDAPGTITMVVNSRLVTGSLAIGQGSRTWTPSTGTVVLTANNTLPSSTFTTFGNLKDSIGTTTLSTNLTVNGSLSVSNGATLAMNTTTVGSPTSLDLECGAVTGSSITGTAVLTLGGNINVTDVGTGTDGAQVACPVALGATRTITVADDGTSATDLTMSGVISGTNFGITKAGVGELLLSGTNTYTGSNTISEGILKTGNTAALGTAAAGTSVSSGAVLDLNGVTPGAAEALTLNGTGISNGGALINSSGTAASYSGAITLASASGIGTTGNITLSSTVLGGFDLTKYGAGTLNMGSATDSLGSLTISAGTYTASSTNTKLLGGFTNNATFTHNSGTVLFMGATAQTLSGTTTATSFHNLTLNNSSGITLSSLDPTIANTLTLTSGNITTGSDTVIIAAAGSVSRTSGHIVGNLKKFINTSTTSKVFEIGDASNYTPVTITNASATGATGSYNVSTTSGDHPNISTSGLSSSKSVNRFYTITKPTPIPGASTFGATLNFVSSDVDAGANTSNFLVYDYNGSSWSAATVGTKTSTSIQITSQTNTGAFQIGELASSLVVTTQPTAQNICAGEDATFSSDASDVVSIKWQRSTNGSSWTDITANLDAGTIYSGFTTTTLTLTGSTTALNTYQYRAIFTNSIGSVNSNAGTLTVNALPSASISGSTSACGSITLTASGGVSYTWDGGSSLETASNTFTSSGAYTVTVEGANGCINTASQTITVLALPTGVTATASSNNLCGAGTINLTGTASGAALDTLKLLNFEIAGITLNYAASGTSGTAGTITGNSGSGDRPASSQCFSSSNTGYRVNNGSATLTTDNITGLAGYTSKKVSLRLAAFSTGSTSNGLDAEDSVGIAISLDGGTTYSNELTIDGNSNAYWAFSATGVATVGYDGNNTPSTFAPTGGGSRNSDGYSTLHITIPDTASQVRIRVTLRNNFSSETWVVDDIALVGTQMAYSWTSNPAGFTSNFEDPQNVSVSETTTFTLTATNADGCTATDTAIVRVNTNVGITSATAASSPICPSATTTLTANGVVGTNAVVTWWTGSGGTGSNLGTGTTITRGPGTYYARVTGDCGSAVEASVTVASLVNAGITSATAASTSVCSGSTTTLTANGAVGTNAVVTWWTGTGGTGTNLGTGTTLSNQGPGTYYARVTADCGSAVEASVTVTTKVNVGITSATAASSLICSSATTTLTANGVVGTNAVVTWWTGTGGTGTNLGTGTTISRGPGTYFARVTGDCGTAVEASVTVSSKVNVGITSATAATSSPICPSATTTLTANGVVGTNAVVTWWTGAGGTGTNLGTGTTITRGPGTYYARVTGDCGTAVEASVTVSSLVNAGITSATAASTSVCSGSTTTLTANGAVGTNAVVTWWTGTGGTGTNLGTGTTLSNQGPGTYYARVTADCGSAVEASVTVTTKVNVGITSATAASSSICSSATTTLTANGVVGTNAVVTWWTATGGTGTNLGTGTTISRGPGTYFARVTGDCGTAVEASVTVSSKVNVGITSATAASSPICPSATTTLTANGVLGTNAVVTWWTGSGGTGSNLGTGTTITPGPGTYYARVTGDCGTAVEASVTVSSLVNAGITSATAASSSVCTGSTTTLTANAVVGTNAVVTWWTATGGTGTNLGTGTTLTNRGPGTYFARVTADCGSAVERSVTVASLAGPTGVTATASSNSICGSGTVNLTGTASGASPTTIAFEGFESTSTYTASGGSTKTGTSGSGDRPASTSFVNSGTESYWANDDNATITTANFTGLSGYSAKTVSMKLAAFSIGSTSGGLDAGDFVTVAISLDGGTTYSNELTINGNNNAYWAFSATGVATVVYDGNNSPTAFSPSGGGSRTSDGFSTLNINIPDDATQVRIRVTMGNSSGSEAWIVDGISLTGTQMSYSWTSDPAGYTSNLKNPTNVSVTQTTTYTLTATNAAGCTATDTAIVRVNTNVGITSATAASSPICSSATTTLTANGVVGTNAVVTWWTGTGGTGTNLGTGTTISRGPGTYFARVTGDCGTAVERSVTVASLASAGITSATAASSSVCSGATTTLTANGVTGLNAVVTWWTATGGTGTNLGTGTTLSNQGVGTYYARVTADCGSAVEASVTVTTKVNIGITSATAASSSICSSATTTLTANGVVGTNAVVTWWTGTGGTGTNLGTGTTISRGPGTYFARVTGDCGSAVEASVTVGVKINVGITNATAASSSICSSSTTTLTANGIVGTNAVVTWWSGTGGTGTNYGTGTTISVGPGTYFARVTGDCGSAVQATVTVSALTNAGITSATAASASICATATTTLTANGVTGLNPVVTWWTGTGGTGTNLGTGTTLTNRSSGTYYARVTADCGTAEASVIVATSATPSVVVGTPTSSDICEGSSQILNASATISSTTIDTVDYNEFVTTSYTTSGSNSGGGGVFAKQNSPYSPNSGLTTITNNVDGSSFMIAVASNMFGSATTTSQLTSTVYNTQGFTDLKIVFNHSYVRSSGSSTVEVSTNGGSSWTTVKTYSSNQGNNSTFVKDSIVLDSYINQSNLRIRFNAGINTSNAASWWAIDKVLLKGNFPLTPLFSWSANTASGVNGLTANAQTYLAANSTITVSPTDTTLYTLTAKDPVTGCTTSATPITVNVLSNPEAPIGTGASRCSTGRVMLMATVGVGETVDWYTVSSGGTATATGTDIWQTPSLSATTTYYIATRNTTTGCVSATRTPVVATINDIDTSNTTVTNCVSYLWNGTTYTNSGTFTYNTTSAAGCDSTALLNLTITVPTESSLDITNCDSYTWNGTTYITGGTYTFTTTNSVGCDSIATLNLTINRSTSNTDNVTNCDTYTWNGTTYSNSGTYSFSTTNSVGCDSTAILNLTINRSSTSSPVSITVCDEFTWNENTYTSSGVYTYSTTNSVGCDSTATLNLTVKKSTTSTTVVEACDAYRWNNATYSASGIFTYTTTNSVGCDSVASLDLTIKYSTSFEFSASNCDNYVWNGVTYSASGTYSFTTTNAVGCDSVATLNLTILESTTSATTESACEQYSWNGITYTNSGTYTYLSTNSSGCSSTDTLHLTIKRATTSTTDEISCETFAWNGSVYSNTGTFTYTTTNSVGCDSVALLNLTILNGTNETIYAESCVNYFINDSLYTESGTYTQRLLNSVGCDSILTIILTINQGTFTSNTVTACDSYLWNNILYTQSGQFIVYYNNALGCLSADTLYLTIKNSTTSTTTISACDSYSWNGEEYTASGVYTFVTTNAVDCDSTATLNLTIETAPNLDPISGLTEVCRYVNTTYTNSTANGRWSSDDTTVLQIDSITGVATAVSAGVANITYTIRTALGCTNSIALAVTVNASTLVSISGPDNVCVADSITLIGSEDGGTWSIDNASLASIDSTTGILLGGVSGNVLITYTYTESSSGCVSTGTYNVVVNALPSAPDSIIGLNELCQYVNTSDTIEYSVPLVSGISNYFWILPVGATLVSGQNTSTIRVLFTNDLPRAGAKICVKSVSDAGCYSATQFLRIYKTTPYLFTVNGPNNACPLVGLDTVVYYSCNISATANYYEWVVPSGATIVSGQGTYQIGVKYDTSFRSSGFVRVRGFSNCGVMQGAGTFLTIMRYTPSTPGFINGPSNTCAYYNNGIEVTYSVAEVEFATSYQWTLPNNVTLLSGQGTNTIVVLFESGFVNSTLKVRAINNCFSSIDRSLNLTANPYTVPAYVSGPTNACMYINTGNMATYVCSKSAGAPAYIWTVPAGVTIIERPGDLPENDTIIRVLYDENFITSTNIQVQTTGCNTSAARMLTVLKTAPAAPTSVTGITNVCNQIGSNTRVRYSTRRVPNATQYLWTVPNNAQVQSYDGDTAIDVTFNSGYVTGMIEARTSNACAVSSARMLSVSRALPATPNDISGPTNSCAYYANGTTATYSIPAVQGATGYAWTLPSYMTLVSGQNTTSITVKFDSGFVTSNIKVKSLNTCAASLDKTLRVTAAPFAIPGTISGPTNSCIYINDGIATYTIRKVANATGYLWTVPTGATIIDHPAGAGASDTIIKVTYTPDFLFGSSIRVQSMGCGLSIAKTLAITGSVSSQPGSITGTSNVCEFMESPTNPNGIIATYRIRKVSSANAYAWTVPDEAEIVGHPGGLGVNDTAIMVKFEDEFIGGSIKVRSSNSCGSSAERSFILTRTQPSIPGAISTTALGTCPNRSYRYSISSMPTNATSVAWTLPSGASIVSQTSLSITVSYPSTAITGTVKAQSFNNCSSSDFRSINVRYNACPNSIIGTTPVVTGRVEEAKVEVAKPLSLGVSVYPNPTTSSFNVKVKSVSAEKLHIKLMDVAGRYLKVYQIMPGENLNFGNELKAGVYMIEVTQGKLKSVERLMKF